MLRVWLLGPMRLELDGVELAPPASRKARLLLAMLALDRRAQSRDSLASRLWPDVLATSARVSLRTALSQLRATLGSGADLCFDVSRERVGLAGSDRVWTDIGELEHRLAQGDLEAAIDVDCSQLLAGLDDEWVYERRDELLGRLVGALAAGAAQAEAGGDLATAIRFARRQAALDPLAEEPQRELIRRLAAADDAAAAISTYERFAERVRAELRIVPSASTRALVEAIRGGWPGTAAGPPELSEPPQPSRAEPVLEPPAVADGEPPIAAACAEAVRKTVTVQFAEVLASTSPGREVDLEVRGRVLSRCLDDLRLVLERHGATVETHVGDVLIAVFGTPVVHEDDAMRAVRAAVGARRLVSGAGADLGLALAARIGIETGEVIAKRGDSIVSGDPVQLARRLCELAAPGELLIGAGTHELVSAAVHAHAASGRTSAGGQAITAFAVDDVRADAPARLRRFDSPIVGRARQLAALQTVLTNLVLDRCCHLVTVLGAAGVGKSRLVEEFARGLRDSATALYGCCLAYGEAITFWPLAEALRGLIGNSEPSAAAIAALAGDDHQAALIGEGVAVGLGARDRPGATNEEIFWAARKLFEALARRHPIVLVFDDLHWAHPTFLDFVEHVSELARDAPIMLLCMARPELLEIRPTWGGGKLNATSVLLEPLDAVQSRHLIANLMGSAPLPPSVVALAAEAAEGNPLFAEEFVAMLIDGDALRLSNGGWTVRADLSRLPVPPTINALLAARLDQLPHSERSLLERAAIEGAHFHRGAVCELSPRAHAAEVDEGLTRLVRKDLIRPDRPHLPGDDGYRFRHVLIRDAAHGSLPKETRAELHERFGSWLERTAGARVREVEEIVGHHFAYASDLLNELGIDAARARQLSARASRRLESAGRRALARGDRPAAIALLEHAATLLGSDDHHRLVGLLTDLGTALFEAGRLSAAEAALERARGLQIAVADECAGAKLLIQRQFLRLEQAPDDATDEAADTVDQVIPVLARHGDEYGLCRAFRLRALLHWFAARTEPAARAWEQAAEHALRAGAQHERAEILVWIASSLVYGPTPVADGIRRCEQIAAEVDANLVAHASALPKLAALHAMEGRFDLADTLLARSSSALQELGLGLNSAVSHHAALVELLAGNEAEAERNLRRGYLALEQMGDRALLSTTAAYLARVILAQGRDQEAVHFAALSNELAGADDISTQAMWRGVKARVLAKGGQLANAERLAREAVALLEQSDFVNQQGEALLDLATVLECDGRSEAAETALADSLRHFEQKGNRVAAAQVRSRLAQPRAR